jgi:hypothetical protein
MRHQRQIDGQHVGVLPHLIRFGNNARLSCAEQRSVAIGGNEHEPTSGCSFSGAPLTTIAES